MVVSPFRRRLGGFWAFYREYTDSPIHTASAAALAMFGLLVFVDPLFVVLAIGSYVVPPVVLYVFVGRSDENRASPRGRRGGWRNRSKATNADRGRPVRADRTYGSDVDRDGDTDTDTDDGDTDTDADTDDGDAGSFDGDSDTDRDRDDGDSDSDRDASG